MAKFFEKLFQLSKVFVGIVIIVNMLTAIALIVGTIVKTIINVVDIIDTFPSDNFIRDLIVTALIDIFNPLVAALLIVFSYGLYEFFISDGEKKINVPRILAMNTLDDLKDILTKMTLLTFMFWILISLIGFQTPNYLSLILCGLLFVSFFVCIYFLRTDTRSNKTAKSPE